MNETMMPMTRTGASIRRRAAISGDMPELYRRSSAIRRWVPGNDSHRRQQDRRREKKAWAPNGRRRSTRDMMSVLNGRTGILVFSNLRYGTHTELWDVDHMYQRDIS